MLGDTFTANVLRIGKGALNLHLEGNMGLAVRNSAGTPIRTETPPLSRNLLKRVWPTRLALPAGSGAANPTAFSQSIDLPSGHLAGAGVWLRTDSATATAWVEIFDRSAVYTGSLVNQPHRQSIGTEWEWVSTNIGTDAEAGATTTGVRLRVYKNDFSNAKAVYLRAPQAWRDIAGTPARSTIQSFSETGRDTRRSNTSDGHSATLPSKP